MLKLICGRSGTGKTSRILNEIRRDTDAGRDVLFLVPEQQLWSMEDTMARLLPPRAAGHLQTLSFSRLAQHVFDRTGGRTVPFADKTAKSMILWKTLRDLKGSLPSLENQRDTRLAHLIPSLLDTAEDLRVNALSPEELENAAEALPEDLPLRDKLRDLAAICALYESNLNESSKGLPHDQLLRAAEALRTHPLFEGVTVYMDSFTLLTAPEYTLLREIAGRCADMTVTLCTDPQNNCPAFDTVNATRKKLIRMAEDLSLGVETVTLSGHEAGLPEPLAALEETLWDFSKEASARRVPLAQDDDTLRVVACPHVYAEAEACALHIMELVQNGYKFDEIAVIVRDTETWNGILDAAFEKYGIPFFLSEKIKLNSQPLVRLILSALHAIESDWSLEDILTLAKTGLCGIRAYDVQIFSEYCETWNIHGKRFLEKTWTMNPDGFSGQLTNRGKYILKTANRVRKELMEPLETLYTALRGAGTLFDMCRAVAAYLERLDIPERLGNLSRDELEDGRYREACDTLRIGNTVIATLSMASDFLHDEKLSISDFSSLLNLVFSQADMGDVPQTRGCVMVGSASMLRTEKVPVTLILGLNEGEFPHNVTDNKFLTRKDKDLLARNGVGLPMQDDRQTSDELFYLYRAVTRPTDKLWLSYHTGSDINGEGSSYPSLALTRILRLFPDLKPIVFDPSALRSVSTRKNEEPIRSPIDVNDLLGTTLFLTQSHLQSFVLCPYGYYCKYVLKLRENQLASLDAANAGTFVHAVLEKLIPTFVDATGALAIPDPDPMHATVDRIVNEYIRGLCTDEQLKSGHLMHLFRRLRALAVTMADNVREEFLQSLFVPAAFELRIGGKDENALPPATFDLDGVCRVCFSGTVDRVDVFRENDTTWIRVVDYKTGRKEFSIDDVKSGLNLQLLLYLFMLCAPDKRNAFTKDHSRVAPAGAMYLSAVDHEGVTTPLRSGLILNEIGVLKAWSEKADPQFLAGIATDKKGNMTGRGLISENDMKDLDLTIRQTVSRIAGEIRSGKYDKTPSPDACRFCPIRSGCTKCVKK